MSRVALWVLLVGGIIVSVGLATWASVRSLGGWAAFMHEVNNPRAEPRVRTSHYWYACAAAVVGWVIVIHPLGGDVSRVAVVAKVALYVLAAAAAHRWTQHRSQS